MVQVPQQVLNNLNLHLTAETPTQFSYGYEQEMVQRKRDESYEDEYAPQNMYGQETYPESDYDENDDYEDENFDYGRRNDDYDREYQENISMSNFGYSPDIIGGDLIDYDNPYSNNDFDDREIVDYGGKPYGDWWNLNNIVGDMRIPKGESKDFVGVSTEKFGQASFDDLFGFSGVNPKGTLGEPNAYDPQTMFGIKDFIKSKFSKKSTDGNTSTSLSTEVVNDDNVEFGDFKADKNFEKEINEEINRRKRTAKEGRKRTNVEEDADTSDKKDSLFKKAFNKASEKIQEQQQKEKDEKQFKHELQMEMAKHGLNPYTGRDRYDSYRSSSSGSSSPVVRIGNVGEDATKNIGMGDADIIGFEKLGASAEDGGLGNADVFGFASMRDNDVGETDTFGFRQMGENAEMGRGASSESTFGFKIGVEGNQSAKDVFGMDVGGGIGNRPATFSETFGFKIADETPQNVEIRANLSSLSRPQQKKVVYKTNYKPSSKKQYVPTKQNFEFPATPQPAPVQQVEEPQRHQGMYNRIGKMFENNQDYASNFQSYGYNLNVGNMLSGNDDDQLIGFNADVLGLSAPPKSHKVRVTSYTFEGDKLTKRSTKVNGKYIEKKKKSAKKSSKGGKKKSTKQTKKVKPQKSKMKMEDDYFGKLIWG